MPAWEFDFYDGRKERKEMGGRNEGILDWTRESGFCMDCLAEKYPE